MMENELRYAISQLLDAHDDELSGIVAQYGEVFRVALEGSKEVMMETPANRSEPEVLARICDCAHCQVLHAQMRTLQWALDQVIVGMEGAVAGLEDALDHIDDVTLKAEQAVKQTKERP